MVTTFKLASIKILEEAKKPLRFEEIVRIAKKQNLIKTNGKTPEQTMNALIALDIKRNGKKSKFIRVAPGTFYLNKK